MKTVFVSSTFRDMQFERDAIREITAPLLNAEARAYGDEIDFCDLRWGIDTAELETDTGSRKILEVCLNEIDRCKPPMIVLLGYRYGWIPDKSLIEDVAARKNRQLEARSLLQMQLEDLEMSVTALEIEYGSLRDVECFSNTLFYFREIEGDAPADYKPEDAVHAAKIKALKERIRTIGRERIKTYTLHWNGFGFDGVDDFAHTLANDIKTMLLPQWELYKKLTPFERECRTHQIFVEEKAAIFRAHKEDAEKLYISINDDPVTIIKGDVGSGKTTLFCHLVQRFQEKKDWVVIPFISGLTSSSNDAYAIIENTIYFIEKELNLEHYTNKTDQTGQSVTYNIDVLRNRLAEMCAAYTADVKKLLIMLDAADQLAKSEVRDSLYFIPMNTGEKIHFAMTCTPDFKTPGREFYPLKPINDAGKRDVISGTLSRAGRELSKLVIEEMIALKSSNIPLYLSLLIQRLLMMNSTDFADIRSRGDGMLAIEAHQIELITKNCPDDLDKMSAALLTEAGNRINPALVSKAGQLLAVSRSGLRSRDLSAMLGDDWTEIDFAHFISYMNDCFMQRDDGRYDFTHKSLREGFLKLCPDIEKINSQILTYLKSLQDDDPVKINEIIFHTICANDKTFFLDYIAKYYANNILILQAANDTHEKCMTDGGKWIISVLEFAEEHILEEKHRIISVFICFKLRERFSNSQKELDIQLRILKENVVFAEKLNTTVNDNNVKHSLSISYGMLASVYEQIGGTENLIKSLKLYFRCYRLFMQLHSEQNTTESMLDLARSCNKIAGIYVTLGGHKNLYRAIKLYKKELGFAEQNHKKSQTADSKRFLLIVYERIGDVYRLLEGQKNLNLALEMYYKRLKLSEQLNKELFTTRSRRDLSISFSKVACIYTMLDGEENLEQALELYLKYLEISEQLNAQLCTVESRREVSVGYEKVADIYNKLGGFENLEKALTYYTKELDIAEQINIELQTVHSNRFLSVVYNKIAGVFKQYSDCDNLQHALEFYYKGLELRKDLYSKTGTLQSMIDLSYSYHSTAEIYEKLGGCENLEQALKLYKKGLEFREKLADKLGTISAHDDLLISLLHIAAHKMTPESERKLLIGQALEIAEKLFRETQAEKYQTMIKRFTKELQKC